MKVLEEYSLSVRVLGFASFLAATLLTGAAAAEVVITEVMYNPPQGGSCEYLEIHNSGAAPVDISGWMFTSGIDYTFPDGTTMPPGAHFVVCRFVEAIKAAYPSLPAEVLFGDFDGSLANEGERIVLSNPAGTYQEPVIYDDELPWDFLADGFGASLERVCVSADPTLPENWRASPCPASSDAFGGSPGAPGSVAECPPVPPLRRRVLISEVMYHPVLEEALEDHHEFIEIWNGEEEPISLEGWRLVGGATYTFPAGAAIAPGQYRVIAKDRAELAAVAKYGLTEEDLFGDYGGGLDNGGDKVALVDAGGLGIDRMAYDDDAPWPVGADALGAETPWLRPALLPLEAHRYMGHSLERVSLDVSPREVANWAPSPLDGATPGKANASARAAPLPVVAELLANQADGADQLIRANKEVLIQARFSPASPSGAVEIEYFIDDIMGNNDTAPATVPMFDDGQSGGDLASEDDIFSAILPGQPQNSVVRYRIRADRGEGAEIVSPRPTDPNDWHAYFVSPVINTTTRVYQVLISPASWGKMWTNIQSGRASGCSIVQSWDAQVPAVFIHEGRVIDVRVRYQGSRYNRTNGPAISPWPYPRPSTGSLLALSWRIGMPRYNQLEGKSALILNKLTQGCPGYNAGVGYRLYELVDVPGPQTRFIRFHVNGGYYHYMIELEHPDEEMMRRYHDDMARKHPDLPREPVVGHLFKSMGCNCDEGPWGWGDERALNAACGFTKEQRYQYTYERKTHDWDSHAEFISIIEDLNAARRAGIDAMRAYFAERFDMELLLNHMAVMNYSVPFDDMFQNHFLYQRLSDGKWIIFPWDLDQNFGEWKGASASLYMGQQGDVDNRSGWWNYLKDAFLKSYRTEFEDRLLLLNNTVLHPDEISKLVDDVTAQANPQEAASAPGGFSCSFPARAASFKSFALTRFNFINTKLAGVSLNAGADKTAFAGATVQFDASASSPDPGPDVTYEWDNGMQGEKPTFVFEEAGTHVVTLTVTVRKIPFQDAVTITVLPEPALAHKERDGLVVLEAESFAENDRHDARDTWWEADSAQGGFSGAGYMEAKQQRRQSFLTKYAGVAPELRYAIVFQNPGTYRVWLRALSISADADTCYVGLDGEERNNRYAQQFAVDPAGFLWSGDTRLAGPQLLTVSEPGLQLFSVWVRESGQIVDKIILSKDEGFTPSDAGPPESERGPVDGEGTFIRGDADGDWKLNVSDAIAILLHLFAGGTLSCEDPADVDDNGSVELTDAVALLGFLFQHGAEPAPPFPTPGNDTTPDSSPCGDG